METQLFKQFKHDMYGLNASFFYKLSAVMNINDTCITWGLLDLRIAQYVFVGKILQSVYSTFNLKSC